MYSRVLALSNLLRISQRQTTKLISGIRPLFSESFLGVEGFSRTRQNALEQTRENSAHFREKMQDFSDPGSPNLVFTEDLKLMLYIAENNNDDLSLLHKMIVKFQSQNKELRFGTFTFGPVAMRFYYLFNLPREALKLFRDPAVDGFFDQVTTLMLLTDLLFKNEMYDEVLEVYETVRNKQIANLKHPRNVMLIVFATYYRLNTPEAYQKSLALLKELQEAGHSPLRRALCCCAVLALRHGQPGVALEVISLYTRQGYITVRNIKAYALAAIGRVDDALPVLRYAVNTDAPIKMYDSQGQFFQEVIEKVEEAVIKFDRKEVTLEFNRIKQLLEESNGIMKESFDDFLLKEINPEDRPYSLNPSTQHLNASYSARNLRGGFNQSRGPGTFERRQDRFPQVQQRPGLKDLV